MRRRSLAGGAILLAVLVASLEAQKIGRVSTGNSTTATLGSNATFTGTFDDVLQCTVATVVVKSNVAGATNGLTFTWSDDGATTIYTTTKSFTDATNGQSFDVPCAARYLKISYLNGGSSQGSFRLQTIVRDAGFGGPSSGGAGGDVNIATYGGAATSLGQKTMANSIPVVLPSDQFVADGTGTLQSAAVANGNGSTLSVGGLGSVVVTVNCASCSGGTAVNFEGTEDGANYTAVWASQQGTNTIASATTTAGVTVWQFPVGAVQTIRARVSAYSAGTVTVTAHASSAAFQPYVTNVNVVSGGGTGGTSSTYGVAFPGTGTAAGFSDGTNMQGARVFDADSGAGTQYVLGALLKKPASGGAVDFGTSSDPVRTDPTGTTTQPVSAASLPLPTGAATEATLGTRLADATYTGRTPAGASPADAESNTITTLSREGAFNYVFNGATWDRQRGDTTNGAFVNVKTSVLPTNAAAETGGNLAAAKTDLDTIVASEATAANQATGNSTLATIEQDLRGANPTADTTLLQIVRTLMTQGTPRGAMYIKGAFGNIAGTPTSPLYVVNAAPVDPCLGAGADSVAISQTTNTVLLRGRPGQYVVFCAYTVVGADAENLSFVEGFASTCGTTTTAIVGGTTAAAGFNFAANGGASPNSGSSWIARGHLQGADVCLFQSGAGRVAGSLKFAFIGS